MQPITPNQQPQKEAKDQKKQGQQQLKNIIDMMKGIESHTVDPFLLNVDEIIKIIKEYFPKWNQPEEFNLDSEAINRLASIIKLQSEWVKQRSTSLYTDPFLLEEKILQKNKDQIITAFLKAWHPIVEQETLTARTLTDGLIYWDALSPIKDRWPEFLVEPVQTQTTNREDLVEQSFLRDEMFSTELDRFWDELKNKVQNQGKNGKILYLDFVGANTYEETVRRAYLTSFLVTYGYATLEIIPLEDEIYIIPLKEPVTRLNKQAASVAIALDFQNWQTWKQQGEKQ
ncbi:MAG: hypothetical protein GX638_16980 [Crenarchaeota archaeon]|nr:hypothetical protein [Thermoproteota archaeon]